jgi:hypothetical protein
LDIEIQRDPVPAKTRLSGHLYLVAQPIGASNRLAHSLVRDNNDAIHDLILRTPVLLASDGIDGLVPTPMGYAQYRVSRSNGVALCSHELSGPGRTMVPRDAGSGPDGGRWLDIELRQDGGIRILVGRMTASFGRESSDGDAILDGLAVAYARRLVGWVTAVGERTGWRGTWILGVHGDGLRGLGSYLFRQSFTLGSSPTFDEASYREVTTATHLEMLQRPELAAYRLVGRLVEGLGTWARFQRDLAGGTSDS